MYAVPIERMNNLQLLYHCDALHTATAVTVGLQQTMYSVMESDGVQLVCTKVLSGSVAGRTITINYETADGVAVGEQSCCMAT